MKIKGYDFTRPSIEVVVLPRGYDKESGQRLPDVIFRCQPVRSYKQFEDLVKLPEPPAKILPGGTKEYNYEDPTYLEQTAKHGRARYDFIVLESLKATEGLTWDTVNYSKPDTWSNWEQELQDAGFSVVEIGRIQEGVLVANSLSQSRLDEALANFQRGQAGV